VRLRRAEEIETLSYRIVVELNAESRLSPERRVATIARRIECPSASLRSGPTGQAPPAPAHRPCRPQRPTGRARLAQQGQVVADRSVLSECRRLGPDDVDLC
jgi:hypothetical protein